MKKNSIGNLRRNFNNFLNIFNFSSSEKKSKYMTLIGKYSNTFCFVLYLAGIIWFSALSFNDLQSKTYFSENALLPGE
jgi:hypothetical protein